MRRLLLVLSSFVIAIAAQAQRQTIAVDVTTQDSDLKVFVPTVRDQLLLALKEKGLEAYEWKSADPAAAPAHKVNLVLRRTEQGVQLADSKNNPYCQVGILTSLQYSLYKRGKISVDDKLARPLPNLALCLVERVSDVVPVDIGTSGILPGVTITSEVQAKWNRWAYQLRMLLNGATEPEYVDLHLETQSPGHFVIFSLFSKAATSRVQLRVKTMDHVHILADTINPRKLGHVPDEDAR
jgi:hypothetical protein